MLHLQFVGNKAKVRISKQMFQENKARQIFQKTIISYPLIRTRQFRPQLSIYAGAFCELVKG